jgi:hypothetical protein
MRTILFLWAIILLKVVSAQNKITSYEYWFNGNYTAMQKQSVTPSPNLQLNTLLSTNSLKNGLHLLSMRFKDDSGRYSPTIAQFFYKPAEVTLPSNAQIITLQYWFNQAQASAVTENLSPSSSLLLDRLLATSSLADGLHLFNLRFKDNRGLWSPAISHFFYKAAAPPAPATGLIRSYQYWFNANFSGAITQTIVPSSPYQLSGNLDLSSLKSGVHLLHVRFADQRGLWSPAISQFVYIGPSAPTTQNKMDKMQYWFNNQHNQASVINLPKQPIVQLTQMLETADLTDGLHMLHVRFADSTGKWSPAISQFFYKSQEFGITNNVITGYRYWFNDAPADNIVYHRITAANPFNLITVVDMGCLTNGDNRLMMQFRDSAGQWSAPMVDTITVTAPADKTLRFIGNGNWSNSANWKDGMKPAPDAPNCREIIIDHVAGGTCILDVPQTMLKNSKLIVMPGKKLIVPSIEMAPQQLEPDN